VLGLRMRSGLVKKLMSEYVEMVSEGLSFLTAYPEECVLGSLMNKLEYELFLKERSESLYINTYDVKKEEAKELGYKFVQRHYG